MLNGMTLKETDVLIAPEIGDRFCFYARGEEAHYAYGEVEDVRPGEYDVEIVVWENP